MRQFLFLPAFVFMAYTASSQPNAPTDSVPAYIRTRVIPEFTAYKAPDSTVFTRKDLQKGKPELLMVFSPDCGHCQHVTTEILHNIAHFKKTQIVMTTWLPYNEMMRFYKTYNIAAYPQITMAWDPKYFFLPYYHVSSFPKLIVYDKKGNYLKEFQGPNIQIEEVWKALGKK